MWKDLRRHPLSSEYKDIAGPDWYAFTIKMKQLGFLPGHKIILHEQMVLDGWQRLRACLETATEPEFEPLPAGVDPKLYVEAVNDARRHESEAERQARRERVVKKVAEEGKSVRSIAEEEGVSRRTVDRDIEAMEEAGGAPIAPPEGKVVGKDKKKQSATKALPLCKSCQHRKKMKRPALVGVCENCEKLRQSAPAKKPAKSKKTKSAKSAPKSKGVCPTCGQKVKR